MVLHMAYVEEYIMSIWKEYEFFSCLIYYAQYIIADRL